MYPSHGANDLTVRQNIKYSHFFLFFLLYLFLLFSILKVRNISHMYVVTFTKLVGGQAQEMFCDSNICFM